MTELEIAKSLCEENRTEAEYQKSLVKKEREDNAKLVGAYDSVRMDLEKERIAKEEAIARGMEGFAWGEKMRERLEQFASATCAGLHGGDCGECFSCKARKSLTLTLPQVYKEWASRMGRLRASAERTAQQECLISGSLNNKDADCDGEGLGPCYVCESRLALSDQEGKR